MVTIVSLWTPILLSAVIVFVASSILHMVMTYHRSDYRRLPDEDAVLSVMREKPVAPGYYAFPHHRGPKEMKTPEMIEKFQKGPVGLMAIIPNGTPSMGKYLCLWFGYCILMGVLVAYITGRTLDTGTHYLSVFRVAGAVAFIGYGIGHIQNSIWMGMPWSSTIKHVVDGFIYSLLTAGTFGWLWPR
jgi:hypothetical protein